MPLLWLSVAFAGGILLASAVRLPWPFWLGLAVVLVALAFFENKLGIPWRLYVRWRALSRVAAAAVLVALCLGGLRYALTQLPLAENDLAARTGERLDLSGLVSQPPQVGESYTSILLQADQPWQGAVMVRLPAGSDVQYGDRLRLVGELQPFPASWSTSYTAYLQRKGVSGVMYFPVFGVTEREAGSRWLMGLYRTRERGLEIINNLLPPKEAALLSGILLGMDDDLPEATQEAFRATGTAHLTAISGVNIAIVISLVFGLFRKLAGRIGGLGLSILAITAFTLLVGAPASAVRAALMGGLGLAGEQIGRRRAGIHALCLTAAVMTAFNPAVLWDAGFQLSFSATLGILWLNEPLQKGFTKLLESALPGETARKIARPLGDYLIVTLGGTDCHPAGAGHHLRAAFTERSLRQPADFTRPTGHHGPRRTGTGRRLALAGPRAGFCLAGLAVTGLHPENCGGHWRFPRMGGVCPGWLGFCSRLLRRPGIFPGRLSAPG